MEYSNAFYFVMDRPVFRPSSNQQRIDCESEGSDMARKQNQKALYEAIRQGQAKIAEGLKTGQMRSDRKRFVKGSLQSTPYVPPAAQGQYETTEYDSNSGSVMSPKTALILLAVIVQVFVLVLGVWLGAAYFRNKSEVTEAAPEPAVATIDQESKKPERTAPVSTLPAQPVPAAIASKPARLPEPTEKKPDTVPPVKADPASGGNVIVIQGIEQDRKGELTPLKDFFQKKGIATEVIIRDGRALLVTSETFSMNPESRGTPGYALLLQIKESGLLYPKETGDTKFGFKPFQDCYGLLK